MQGELNRLGNVNRASLGDKIFALTALANESRTDTATNKTVIDEIIAMLNEFVSDSKQMDQVLRSATAGAGVNLDVDDGDAADIETNNAVTIQHRGAEYQIAASAALDISAAGTGAGDTVATSKAGSFWVAVDTGAQLDVESVAAAATYDTAIESLAAFSVSANTIPVAADEVLVGVFTVVEGGSGAWTLGTDSITGETETYYSLWGRPRVDVAAASFALDASAATFTYGAATLRLGTGVVVSATGKANVVIAGSNVADGAVGAWLFYVLADDSEHAVQLDATYTTLALAQVGVRDHNPNPLLPLVGVIYVVNDSGSAFVPGTTNLDATGVTATLEVVGPGGDHLEVGRAALNQPHQVVQNASAAAPTAAAVDVLL